MLADLIIRAKQTYASVAGSRDSEGHHVRECTAGTQKTSREDEDNERAIGGAILETHSCIAISRIFGEHKLGIEASLAGPIFHWVCQTAE